MHFRRSLGESSGAIMIFGVFMAAVLTGAVWFLIGIGDAITHKQQMQGASDAAAFSSGVLYARGMNLTALLNLTMAGGVTVLAGFQLLQSVLMAASLLCASDCPAEIANLNSASSSIDRAFESSRPELIDALKVSTQAGNTLRTAIPYAAQHQLLGNVAGRYGAVHPGPVKQVFAWPAFAPMPTEKEPLRRLCTRVSDTVQNLANRADQGLPDPAAQAFNTFLNSNLAWLAPQSVMAFCEGSEGPVMPNPTGQPSQSAHTISNPLPASDANDIGPQEVVASAVMGQDPFQIRCVALGSTEGLEKSNDGLAVSMAGRGSEEELQSTDELAHSYGRFSIAQAEFYYDGLEPFDEWMWHMAWRARLRRVRPPTSGESLDASCASAPSTSGASLSSACSGLGAIFKNMSGIMIH